MQCALPRKVRLGGGVVATRGHADAEAAGYLMTRCFDGNCSVMLNRCELLSDGWLMVSLMINDG